MDEFVKRFVNLLGMRSTPYPALVNAVTIATLFPDTSAVEDCLPADQDQVRVALGIAAARNNTELFDVIFPHCSSWDKELFGRIIGFALEHGNQYILDKCLSVDGTPVDQQGVQDALLSAKPTRVSSKMVRELLARQRDKIAPDVFVRIALERNVPDVLDDRHKIPDNILKDLVDKPCLSAVKHVVEHGEEVKNSHVTRALASKQYDIAQYLSEKLE